MKVAIPKAGAIILDMDGVIVDSMPYHFIAWYEALRPLGVRLSCFDVYLREGEKWQKTLKELLERSGVNPTKAVLRKTFLIRQKIFKKYFKRYIFKDVREFIRCLKNKNYLLGLVTGTPQQEMVKILPKDIRDFFDGFVCGNNVKRGKPHPEPYLKMARILGVKNSECIVIENAPLGIESAKKAGMFCIALSTSLPAEYLRKADIVADTLSDVSGLIENKCSLGRK